MMILYIHKNSLIATTSCDTPLNSFKCSSLFLLYLDQIPVFVSSFPFFFFFTSSPRTSAYFFSVLVLFSIILRNPFFHFFFIFIIFSIIFGKGKLKNTILVLPSLVINQNSR